MAEGAGLNESNLREYQEQLAQVEQLLLEDHENQELLDMYNGLQEVRRNLLGAVLVRLERHARAAAPMRAREALLWGGPASQSMQA